MSENESLGVIHCSNYSEGWVKCIGQISQQDNVENLNCDESGFGDAFVKLNHTRLSRKMLYPKPVENVLLFSNSAIQEREQRRHLFRCSLQFSHSGLFALRTAF